MANYDSKLNRRKERYAVSPEQEKVIGTCGAFSITAHKRYKGVRGDNSVGLDPVFDDVILDGTTKICGVSIDGAIALADIFTGDILTSFEYDKIEFVTSEHSIIIYKDGKKGIFDIARREVVHQPLYDSISNRGASRFSWSFSEQDGYTMIDSANGNKINIGSDIDECFDEAFGHIFILLDGKILMLNDEGYADKAGYRELLSSLNGRIRLHNSVKQISVTADIYGNLL